MIEFYLIYRMFNEGYVISCILMLLFKIIYYFERKTRIKNNTRNDFTILHSFEHLGLYILFSNITNTSFDLGKCFMIFITYILILTFGLFLFNRIIEIYSERRFPEWVRENPALVNVFYKKLKKNQNSLQFRNYICKPWLFHLKIEFISWTHLENICHLILPQINKDEFDIVVGITTGGAFVGAYLAKLLDKPFAMIESKFWSESSLRENMYKSYCHFSGKNAMPKISSIPEVTGLRVLVADDTTYSGITMRNVAKVLSEKGAKEIKTFCLWVRGPLKIDYYYTRKGVPIIWEWGVELD